jgi:cytoskeletal protein CcmA (bactofilin family)
MPANKREDFSVNTIIGPNTHIKGDVNSAGFTRVDGSLRGDLNAAGRIIVGERARMRSDITGTAITIGGVVSGNVLASERVTILATGIVLGDIITQRIQADEGCLLHGRVTICQTREKWDNAVNEYRDIEHLRSVTAGFALPNPPASGAPEAELAPKNEIQAEAETALPETAPLAAEPEEINPAPAAGGETAASWYAAVLPQEEFAAWEQIAPESPAKEPAEEPVENAASENTAVSPDAFPSENTPVSADETPSGEIPPGNEAVSPAGAAFIENAPISSDGTAFAGNAAVLPDAPSPENAPGLPGGAAFTENAPVSSDGTAFTGNTAVSPDAPSPQNTAVLTIPFPGTDNTGEKHGES